MNVNKRLLKEVKHLELQQTSKKLLDNDYIISINEENMSKVHCLIKAPQDSVYKHTFVRLDMDIPPDYPHSPPSVTFVNYDGVRIHPNMYEDGKCCATILNTWPSENEKWTSSMGIETILLTFHSFLDNQPYTHEPGGRDEPSYTVFVRYQTFYTCLLRYLSFEIIQPFKDFMTAYLFDNIQDVFETIERLCDEYPIGYYSTTCFEIDDFYVNYNTIRQKLSDFYGIMVFCENEIDQDDIDNDGSMEIDMNLADDYKCNICFDTEKLGNVQELNCSHTFHKLCLDRHIVKNMAVCPICRQSIELIKQKKYNKEILWVVNPKTQRKIKVGSKTYQTLVEEGVIKNINVL